MASPSGVSDLLVLKVDTGCLFAFNYQDECLESNKSNFGQGRMNRAQYEANYRPQLNGFTYYTTFALSEN